jgi:hypothetical protein
LENPKGQIVNTEIRILRHLNPTVQGLTGVGRHTQKSFWLAKVMKMGRTKNFLYGHGYLVDKKSTLNPPTNVWQKRHFDEVFVGLCKVLCKLLKLFDFFSKLPTPFEPKKVLFHAYHEVYHSYSNLPSLGMRLQ